MVKPITPDDAANLKVEIFPDIVIETWNNIIAKNWDGLESRVLTKDIKSKLTVACEVSSIPYEKQFLDIEPIYRKNGWTVIFDKSDYIGSYESFFVFKRKRGGL